MIAKNRTMCITSVLLFLALITGCMHRADAPDTSTPVTEENASVTLILKLPGIYKSRSDENGETVMQIYRIGDRLIAEFDSEYSAYYAAELLQNDGQKADGDLSRWEFTAMYFSGFSNAGEYWDSGNAVSISLTESGVTVESCDGSAEEYIFASDADSIHDTGIYDTFFDDPIYEMYPEEYLGRWSTVTDDNTEIFVELSRDGSVTVCRKREGQPIALRVGTGRYIRDGSEMVFMTEQVGWGNQPLMSTLSCGFIGEVLVFIDSDAYGYLFPDPTVSLSSVE